jgi:hypothetical protein
LQVVPNKKLNKDKKQLAFCSLRSLMLANNFLPVNWALATENTRTIHFDSM